MAAVYRPLRLRGERLSYIIDDALGIAAQLPVALFHSGTFTMLLTALGFTFSISKCCFLPCQLLKFRGLLLDSLQGLCSIPADKLEYCMQKAAQLLSRGRVSVKDLASVAGMIVSFQPAMPFAMMQARAYYEAIGGQPWDSKVVQINAVLRDEMAFWLGRMREGNGKALWHRACSSTIASDASEIRYAAYTVQGQPDAFVFAHDFTPDELARTRQHEYGSTLRELSAMHRCLLLLLESHRQHMQHARIQWLIDSKSGVADLQRMPAGTPELLQVVRQICRLAMQTDISFDWQWQLRDSPELALAD